MKILTRILSVTLMLLVLTACGAAPTPVLPQVVPAATQAIQATQAPQGMQGTNPYAPQPGDEAMQRGDVTIDSASLMKTESAPPQILLNFSYFPPTPCHQLRMDATPPDAQNRINLTAYALAPKDQPCNLAPLATPLPASLELGTFPPGHYSVWLNGAMVGEFDM